MASPVDEAPLSPPAEQAYSPEERGELRRMLGSDLFKKALANARLHKPALFANGLDTALGPQIGNNRLHQLQGWTLFEAALIKQTVTPLDRPKQALDSYPDEGRIDYSPPEQPKAPTATIPKSK